MKISFKGYHDCCLWKCSCTHLSYTQNLTWLHKSGHWVLCGEGHWSGYRPVQSHCWCLRKIESRIQDMMETERSQGLQLHIRAVSTLQQDQRCRISVTALCVWCQNCKCWLRKHIKPSVTKFKAWKHYTILSAAWETAQQLQQKYLISFLQVTFDTDQENPEAV